MHLRAFLSNRAVNLLNLHAAVNALGEGMGGAFLLVFLLRLGLAVPAVLSVLALILLGRLVSRPLLLVFAKRWGLRRSVILGSLLTAAQYPVLGQVEGSGWTLVLLIVLSALGSTFYWPAYHAYFASLGDSQDRGSQIGAREALSALTGIAAPLAGALILVSMGPGASFALVSVVQALSVIPLLGAPDIAVNRSVEGAYRAATQGTLLFIANGWLATSYFVWQIALFLSLSQSYTAFGGASALAALVGAACGILLGRHIDMGGGSRAALLAYGSMAVVTILRATSLDTPWLVVAANTAGAVAGFLELPAMMTAVYNLAKASPCALRFHIAADGGWDAGCSAGLLIAAGVMLQGAPIALTLLLAFPALAGSVLLLRRHYGRAAVPAKVETPPLLRGASPAFLLTLSPLRGKGRDRGSLACVGRRSPP